MLARHHQGTQKIVISDNIFVTEKNAVMGKLSVERALMLRFISSVTTALPSHLSAGLSNEWVLQISMSGLPRFFHLGKKKGRSVSKSKMVWLWFPSLVWCPQPMFMLCQHFLISLPLTCSAPICDWLLKSQRHRDGNGYLKLLLQHLNDFFFLWAFYRSLLGHLSPGRSYTTAISIQERCRLLTKNSGSSDTPSVWVHVNLVVLRSVPRVWQCEF